MVHEFGFPFGQQVVGSKYWQVSLTGSDMIVRGNLSNKYLILMALRGSAATKWESLLGDEEDVIEVEIVTRFSIR
ncbi:hypothetical protein BRADI_1g57675v3 [Brachypodium distachyon]|uniref:Uncharacterized protein n=1 Tax=Brachypodium distachyon TaxID=15368 RepID=A0A0Q3HDR9_BRADI|nr:hypothetical protein BRADI_1g57675v3 [Brachypodium distachyon]